MVEESSSLLINEGNRLESAKDRHAFLLQNLRLAACSREQTLLRDFKHFLANKEM